MSFVFILNVTDMMEIVVQMNSDVLMLLIRFAHLLEYPSHPNSATFYTENVSRKCVDDLKVSYRFDLCNFINAYHFKLKGHLARWGLQPPHSAGGALSPSALDPPASVSRPSSVIPGRRLGYRPRSVQCERHGNTDVCNSRVEKYYVGDVVALLYFMDKTVTENKSRSELRTFQTMGAMHR